MRRVTWLVLIGAVCIGCAKKEVPLPNVAVEGPDPQAPRPVADAPSGTFQLKYATLWDPKGAEKTDPQVLVKTTMAQRYFATHQSEFLAPVTIGSAVSLTQGGMHGIVALAAITQVYPEAAKKFEAEWPTRLGEAASQSALGSQVLDLSSSVFGGPSTRVLVLRVKPGSDDELCIWFGEYLTRLEDAMQGASARVVAHQRGGIRILGSLSDIRYETETRTGSVRSLVVREYDEKDQELMNMMPGKGGKVYGADFIKKTMTAGKGPYLVVSLQEQRR